MNRTLLAVLASGVWVNFSEIIRNELIFKWYWIEKYESLGLVYPSSDVNGLVWVLWGFLLAGNIVLLHRKLSFKETLFISWLMGFVLMWIVLGNMNVLPFGVLKIAVPWSLVEVALAVIIAGRILRIQKA